MSRVYHAPATFSFDDRPLTLQAVLPDGESEMVSFYLEYRITVGENDRVGKLRMLPTDGIYEGDYGAFENNVLLETTVEQEGRLGKFDNVFLLVGTISFVHAEGEIKLITCVEILEFCFKRFERHTEFGNKLERMLHGSLFYEFVNTFSVICVKAVSHCNVLVHSVKLLCVG